MDIDGDGHPDLISGSWPGEIFLFRGTADHSFAAREMLKYKDGEIIDIGGGTEPYRGGQGILIRGFVERETVDGRSYVTYHGKRIESTPEKPVVTTGTASVVSAADWDGDGDYDLIVGNINGDVYLVPNEGTAESYAFGKEKKLMAGGQPVHVTERAGPCVADWDGDGDLDLLVGSDDGSVWLYSNTGSAKAPELAAGVRLLPSSRRSNPREYSKEAQRGSRSKICVADWNGDGRPDLLVGDFAQQRPGRPDPTPEELTKQDRIRRELEPLQKQYSALLQKLTGPSPVRTKEENDKLNEEMKQLREKMQSLQSQLPHEYENHGWVWLFSRK